MELKLKNDVEEKKAQSKPENLTEDYIIGGNYTNNPVKISTTVAVPVQSERKSSFNVMGIVKWVIIIVVVLAGVKFLSGVINPKSTDVTNYVDMDTAQLESALNVTLETNSDMRKQITHYSNGTVTVDGDGEIGVVYIDGKHKGVHINNKKYNMYGVSIGEGEFAIDDSITYEYENQFIVLDDIMGGQSTATFYYNTKNNDCLVVIINDNSARVVAITYFNDYRLISENLSGLDD